MVGVLFSGRELCASVDAKDPCFALPEGAQGFSVCVRTTEEGTCNPRQSRATNKHVAIQDVQPGSSVFIAAQRAGRVGLGPPLYFIWGVIERLEMSVFEQRCRAEGGELYVPQLMPGVWLYAYALGIPSALLVERTWWRTWRFAIWRLARG